MNYSKEISIKSGIIKGKMLDDEVEAYLGIPFAAPPVGDLRFKDPEPHPGWDGVLECVEYGKSPYQNPIVANPLWTEEFMASVTEISEDCLTINVITNKTGEKMPVVLYHFGGGFVSGGSSCEIYDGTTLARNGVVFVSFNHREGVFGLYLSENDAWGNHLFLDDIMALRWVKENIESFGGDPENVTIMGQSSGGGEVNALTASPLAKGFFKRAFSLGFNSYIDFARPLIPRELGHNMSKRVLEELKVSEDELKKLPPEKIQEADPISNLVIDGHSITKNYKDSVLDGDTNDYPIVFSAVPGDSMMAGIFARYLMDGVKINEKDTLKKLCCNFFKDKEEVAEQLYDFENNDLETLIYAINDDFLISSMLEFVAGRKISGCNSPTYILFFTHVMPGPVSGKFGVFHSSEVPYMLNHLSDYRKELWTEDDICVAKTMSDNLIQFAKDGNFVSKEMIPSDGKNYCLIETGGISNVVFPEEKWQLYHYAFEHMTGDLVIRNGGYSFKLEDYK